MIAKEKQSNLKEQNSARTLNQDNSLIEAGAIGNLVNSKLNKDAIF